MKYNGHEYENMVVELNLNKNKKIIVGSFFVAFIITFIVIRFIDNDFYFNVILALIAGFATKSCVKKSVCENSRKTNFVRDIKIVEQVVCKDKILEKVTRDSGVENNGEYYYRDMILVKEDKNNFYMYLNNNSAIIVGKNKLDDICGFKKILRDNDLIK